MLKTSQQLFRREAPHHAKEKLMSVIDNQGRGAVDAMLISPLPMLGQQQF